MQPYRRVPDQSCKLPDRPKSSYSPNWCQYCLLQCIQHKRAFMQQVLLSLAAAANTSLHGSTLCGAGPSAESAELSALLVLLLDHPQTQEAPAGTGRCSSHSIRSVFSQVAAVFAMLRCARRCQHDAQQAFSPQSCI